MEHLRPIGWVPRWIVVPLWIQGCSTPSIPPQRNINLDAAGLTVWMPQWGIQMVLLSQMQIKSIWYNISASFHVIWLNSVYFGKTEALSNRKESFGLEMSCQPFRDVNMLHLTATNPTDAAVQFNLPTCISELVRCHCLEGKRADVLWKETTD